MVKLNGIKIRDIRASLGLSQQDFIEHLAEQVRASGDLMAIQWMKSRTNEDRPLPISVNTLSNVENDKTKVRLMTARFIAIGLDIEVSSIQEDSADESGEAVFEEKRDLFPMPTMLTGSMIFEGPDEQHSVELEEIIAVRLYDGATAVIGYGRIEKEQLYQLIGSWVGGGFDKLMAWGGVDRTAKFLFKPGFGLVIGPEGRPIILVGKSGTRVRFEFRTGRSGERTSVARYSNWKDADGGAEIRYRR